MDDIILLQESVVNVEEIKQEFRDTNENEERNKLEKKSEEVNAPVAELLQPKVEVEEAEEQEVKTEFSTSESPVVEQNDSEEEELKPLAAVYIKTEVETDEETEEQDHLAGYPFAGCEEWDDKKPVVDPLLREEEGAAGISNERSEGAAAEGMDYAEDASGSCSNRAGSPYQKHEASKPVNEDVLAHSDRQLFTCKTCQRQFTSRRALGGHIKVHNNEAEKKTKFPCETCGKEFKHRDYLKEHLRVHTGEKPYMCDLCGKGFKNRSALIVHRRIHTGEQPYSCSICNKQFADKGTLVKHTRRHLNIKPFGCKECGKTFVQSSDYTVHLRIHTGERPYKCSICSKTFAHKPNLNSHMFTHSREPKQMSECEVCGESFRTIYMITHMRTHTGEKPYKCRYCEATFTQSSNRITHEGTHSTRTRHCEIPPVNR